MFVLADAQRKKRAANYSTDGDDTNSTGQSRTLLDQTSRALYSAHSSDEEVPWDRVYDLTVNAGADVLAITTASASFESAMPSTVRVLLEGFEPAEEVIVTRNKHY